MILHVHQWDIPINPCPQVLLREYEIRGDKGRRIQFWSVSDGSKVKLRAVRCPSGWRTTDDWVTEFLEALTTARTENRLTIGKAGFIRTAAKRKRDHERARKELKASGF